jgi:hypothetical protein
MDKKFNKLIRKQLTKILSLKRVKRKSFIFNSNSIIIECGFELDYYIKK